MNILIRKTDPDEVDALQTIGRQTFLETFASLNTEEDMRKYLDEKFSSEALSIELNNSGSVFYFAELEGVIIGYLKLNFDDAQTESFGPTAVEVERIYVQAAYHGKRIGQLLYEKAIEVAIFRHAEYIWLGVWEENHKAIQFYSKNGFVAFDKHIFLLGDDKQTDILMKRILPSI